MTEWLDYRELRPGAEHTATGTIKVLAALHSAELGNEREIAVYLPPSAGAGDRRYPVVYLHDGQNVFDEAISFAGELRADETLEMLAGEGLEAIAVAVANGGAARPDELSPFVDRRFGGGRGDAYLRFLIRTVKPLVDRDFPTLPGRGDTGLMGSSLGGLISLYAYFRHSDVFGFAGVVSPALWWANAATLHWLRPLRHSPGRIHLDVGTRESADDRYDRLTLGAGSRRYLRHARALRVMLEGKGYREGHDLRYVEDVGGRHNERVWARRLPDTLRFLLPPSARAA
jgi:predicted alpha/beta superfamily hydrolase